MERIYLIKNPSAWMMDELIAFSYFTKFQVLFIRQPGTFYQPRIAQLTANGIDVVFCPFQYKLDIKKLLFSFWFILKNAKHFLSRYSFVVGIKSLWWFLFSDDRFFNKDVSIHAQFATQSALLAMLLKAYFRKQKIEYYFTFHAYDIFFNNRWFVPLVNNATKCFSISEYNIKYVQKKYTGIEADKIEIARLGAFSNPSFYKTKDPKGVFRLGFISWFVEKKGITYLLQAMQVIASKNKYIQLFIAGDGPLRKDIENFIADHQLQESIHYVGKLDNEEKYHFFAELDALVLPAVTLKNDKDGIPVVLMEAISYGLPIISTNISGIPEICIDQFNGLLVPEKNVNALVDAIGTLYNNEQLMEMFSGNALQLFKSYRIEDNSLLKLKSLNWLN